MRPPSAVQKTGATTPSEKFSAETLDRGARDARLVERVRIAADDHPDRAAALVEAPIEPVGDRADMGVETALRRQARGEKRKHGKADNAARRKQRRRRGRRERDRRKIEDERERAEGATLSDARARPVEAPV